MAAPIQHEGEESAPPVEQGTEDDPTTKALQIPVIVWHVMRYLYGEDLLHCSLVNKLWYQEARKILKNHRQVLALVPGLGLLCVKLKELDQTLSRMPRNAVIPWNGLEILEGTAGHPDCVGYQDPEDYYPYILSRLTLKHLEIHWHAEARRPGKSCAAVWLLRKLFSSPYSEQIETLFIGMVPPWLELYSPNVLTTLPAGRSQKRLPNLRVLKLYSSEWEYHSNRGPNIDLGILQEAPNLEELVMNIDGSCADVVPPDKLRCIVNLTFDPELTDESEEELDWLEQVALSGARLQRLEVKSECILSNPDQCQRYWQILGLLLQSSQNTLKTLVMDFASTLKLAASYPLPRFTKLEEFHIGLHLMLASGDQIKLLGRVDFLEMFPSLERLVLRMSLSTTHLNRCLTMDLLRMYFGIQELGDLPQRNVSHQFTGELSVRWQYKDSDGLELVRMFPGITGLKCRFGDAADYDDLLRAHSTLWTLWPELKSLEIAQSVGSVSGLGPNFRAAPNENWDALFCGIPAEEAELLQSKNKQFLKKVHIVPIRPAITCLRRLENLTLVLLFCKLADPPAQTPELFFLSKVTGRLAFRRMAGLQVVLEACEDDLPYANDFEHLEPYMEVTVHDGMDFTRFHLMGT